MSDEVQCQERLTKVFREVFDNPSLEIKDEYNASHIPGWDSLAHISLIVTIEEEFDINISAGEIAILNGVGDIKKLIMGKAKQ